MKHHAAIVSEARPENLGALLQFVEEACARAELPPDVAFAVRLASEEACTNVLTYGYAHGAPGPVAVEFDHDGERVAITIEDQGTPYDPADIPAPDLAAPAEVRRVGGLGWHFIRQVMDEVRHERHSGRGNRLVLVKQLPASTTP